MEYIYSSFLKDEKHNIQKKYVRLRTYRKKPTCMFFFPKETKQLVYNILYQLYVFVNNLTKLVKLYSVIYILSDYSTPKRYVCRRTLYILENIGLYVFVLTNNNIICPQTYNHMVCTSADVQKGR